MKGKVQATARIQVTVEVKASLWSGESTVAQVYDQAGHEAVEKVRRLMAAGREPFLVIGEPRIVTVLTEKAEN